MDWITGCRGKPFRKKTKQAQLNSLSSDKFRGGISWAPTARVQMILHSTSGLCAQPEVDQLQILVLVDQQVFLRVQEFNKQTNKNAFSAFSLFFTNR